jgi:hypothetical protein
MEFVNPEIRVSPISGGVGFFYPHAKAVGDWEASRKGAKTRRRVGVSSDVSIPENRVAREIVDAAFQTGDGGAQVNRAVDPGSPQTALNTYPLFSF